MGASDTQWDPVGPSDTQWKSDGAVPGNYTVTGESPCWEGAASAQQSTWEGAAMTKHGAHWPCLRPRRETLTVTETPRRCHARSGHRFRVCPPQCQPWRLEVPPSMPWSHINPGAVPFTGAGRTGEHSPRTNVKRHNETDQEGPCCKHFLSEEAMMAHFRRLSLSNDHVYGTNGLPIATGKGTSESGHSAHSQNTRVDPEGGGGWNSEAGEGRDVIVEGMFDMSDSHVIVMSPELQRRLQTPPDEILPRNILESIKRPCMEIMLWTPPSSLLQETMWALRRSARRSEEDDKEGERTLPQQRDDEMEQ
ncbi:uncharacterized protein LOC132810748 isoform X2 [Hemiscyllium ocellatum]|uniref:uncharacterized protein LOC132810748 isoform X2 n=1 Tax=Hemiscyllium ocellatum TaxID=170820 RepID=UPI0029670287|nr:uncharacterized protein LOC132810748 isoform X2 [Hemiscyllium ocellatum]